NLALNDTTNGTWEFRTSRRGKLVLFDFWETSCMPCRQAMPTLASLSNKYSPQGLEVVGVALESKSGSLAGQSVRVNAVCQRAGVNYRQLLGDSGSASIRQQFSINYLPTMVLVDENGWVLWRHVGVPDRATLDELERLIQRRLDTRA